MSTTTSQYIDSYLNAVAGELYRSSSLPRQARKQVLAELRSSLIDASADLGVEAALAGFGTPHQCAARIVAEASPTPVGNRLFGMPSNFDAAGMGERLKAEMDPQGPWFVPKAFGIGWDLNWGRLLRATRLVRPDDIDADVGRAIPTRAWRVASVAWAAPLACSAAVWVGVLRTKSSVPLHWTLGPADRWGSPSEVLGGMVALGALAAAAGGASLVSKWPVQVRLAAVCLATFLADLAASIALMTWAAHASRGWWSFVALLISALESVLVAAWLVRSGRNRAPFLRTSHAAQTQPEQSQPMTGA